MKIITQETYTFTREWTATCIEVSLLTRANASSKSCLVTLEVIITRTSLIASWIFGSASGNFGQFLFYFCA